MQQILLTLADQQPNLFGGVTVTYWHGKGDKIVQDQQHYMREADIRHVTQFIFNADRKLLITVVQRWINSVDYLYKTVNVEYDNWKDHIKPILDRMEKHLQGLRSPGITPNQAGEVSELISLEWLRIRPRPDKVAKLLKWLRINQLIDDFRYKYSLQQKSINNTKTGTDA